jgi:vacuolar-type H+-ATPase catalytic subunit A/Vma1
MLEYVGPKPHISHTGIDFDNNKEDKYVYLHIVVQLIKALSHDYFEDKKYTYTTDDTKVDARRLMHELKTVCKNLPDLIKKENISVEEEIEENIQRAHENKTLTKEDKITLENNINIMHDYLVQRAINKSVYYCSIKVLADLLKKDHIDYIITPMYPQFTHVLHSVQGVLVKEKFPIDTKIDIYKEDSKLFVKLQVINL